MSSFLHFVDEVLFYCMHTTLLAVSISKILTQFCLQSMYQALDLHLHIPLSGILTVILNMGLENNMKGRTIAALETLSTMVSDETRPLKQDFRVDDFFQAFNAIAWLQSLTFGEDIPLGQIRHAQGIDKLLLRRYVPTGRRRAFADVASSEEITKFVKFAVGTYGQASLKFLGVIPYGSASTNEQAAALCSGISSPKKIIRARWDGSLYLPGYFLSIIEDEAIIVLAIRGTLWPQDFLTDLICQSSKCVILGTEGYVHGGMYKCAMNLSRILLPVLRICLADERYSNFRLILTGHSLGAGVAAILTAMWMEKNAQLDLWNGTCSRISCFGYGTPCVFSPAIIAHPLLQTNVISVVIRDDMVPRFSLHSFRRMRNAALHLWREGQGAARAIVLRCSVDAPLASESEPSDTAKLKQDELQRWAKQRLSHIYPQRPWTPNDDDGDVDMCEKTTASTDTNVHADSNHPQPENVSKSNLEPQLCPCGRVVWVDPTVQLIPRLEDSKPDPRDPRLEPPLACPVNMECVVLTDAEELAYEFRDILISESMFSSHMPNNYLKVLAPLTVAVHHEGDVESVSFVGETSNGYS
jgi:hypothetical protein